MKIFVHTSLFNLSLSDIRYIFNFHTGLVHALCKSFSVNKSFRSVVVHAGKVK